MFEEKDENSLEEEILQNKNQHKDEEVTINMSSKARHFNSKFKSLQIKDKKDPKKLIVFLSSILVMLSMVIGSSYAYLTMTSKTNNSVTINAGNLALTFQNESNTISLQDAVPVSDQEGLAGSQEYSFDIKNNGSIPATYTITLDNICQIDANTDICIPDDYIKVGLKIGDDDYKVLAKKGSSYILDTGNLSKNEFHKYKMKIWLDYDTPNTYNSAGEKTVVYSGKLSLSYEQVKGMQVTLDANGGIIPTGNDWTGSGEFATKTVFYEGTYGTLPEPTRSGYTFKEWGILPYGYQQVESITSSGTQYIDTEVFPKNNTKIELDMALVTTSVGDQKFMGSYGNGGIALGILGDKWRYGGIGDWYPQTDSPTVTTNRTKIIVEGYHYIFNDVDVHVSTPAISDNNQHSILLFAVAYNGDLFQKSSIKVYNLKLYENKTLVRNFIPCINTTTNKAGLYDLVENKFYDNVGEGSFISDTAIDILSSSKVVENNDHTLKAIWEEN